jgi:UDP-glucose-4-epimerase GalE
MESVLVVGGAGYIGSYMCKYLSKNGYRPVVLDNFSRGHRMAVKYGDLYEGHMEDNALLDKIFTENTIDAVMHFAAYCYVGESVKKPDKYYKNNVAATLNLLEAMVKNNVNAFIFSSTCATYGNPVEVPVSEDHPQEPINPYGRSKLIVEKILQDFYEAFGLKYISLRYFNAAGADPEEELGEDHRPETHLIPLVLQTALGLKDNLEIYGNDYPTPDGTCIRDYIHIVDLAHAHMLALERMMEGHSGDVYNLGNGNGYSVHDVIEKACHITKKTIQPKITDRRQGDPPRLVSSSKKAFQELGWRPKYHELDTIIETAWRWHKNNPKGYKK